jgi:hypothetical protein
MSHCAPLPRRAVTITRLGDEAALIDLPEHRPSGLRRLSQCLDLEQQDSHMVATRER